MGSLGLPPSDTRFGLPFQVKDHLLEAPLVNLLVHLLLSLPSPQM